MNIFLTLLKWDLVLLVKYRILGIAAIVAILYMVIFLAFPIDETGIEQEIAIALIFSDPSVMGFLFIGAIVLFEKDARTLQGLVVTPIKVWQYLWSKSLSLTLMALPIGITIAVVVHGPDFHYLVLGIAIVLASLLFVFTGFIGVARVQTLNQYLIVIPLLLTPLCFPLLELFGIMGGDWMYIIPSKASFLLFEGAFSPIRTWEWLYAVGYSLVSIGCLYMLAKKSICHLHYPRIMNPPTSPSWSVKFWTLAKNDLRQIFRDKVLVAILLFPLATVFIVRYIMPWVLVEWPVLEPYALPIIGLICVVNASFPAYVISFIMLDEKDAGLFTALRVTPVSSLMFAGYRLVFITFLGGFFALLTLLGAHEIDPDPGKVFLAAILCGLGTPLISLAVVIFARNKIEGITLLKGLNFVFILPFLAFFMESEFKFGLGVIPYFWTYMIFGAWKANELFFPYAFVGIISHFLVLMILYQFFRKRIF